VEAMACLGGRADLVLLETATGEPARMVDQALTPALGEGLLVLVPISIIADDPAVLKRIAGWGWNPGLRPRPQAPVWPMSAFRDRFLTAFGPRPAASSSP
jgi:hypothetical protein